MFKIIITQIFVLLFFINHEQANAAEAASALLDQHEQEDAAKKSTSQKTPLLAIIPAAGRGARFGEAGVLKPKGFIEVEGQPIIYSSIEHLVCGGIERILFITGHCSKYYEELSGKYKHPIVGLLHNPDFAKFGNMHTIYLAKDSVAESVLLLDSDIIYPVSALQALINDPHPNVMLSTTTTKSGDEVYVEADGNGNLLKLSKNKDELEIDSESVGIYKLSRECFQAMCNSYETALKKNPDLKMEYEHGLVAVCKEHPVHVLKMRFEDQCPWTEIDTQEHYERAVSYVLPLMKELEGK
ncbi:MAG: phosphocholine cytidylyltransferase family protein [Proteobacteria bacterium]|nr:phosphocholine cytidylyltransferase family protein [Pseudomonadota bacterium]